MKILTTKVLLLLCLATGAGLAGADHRFEAVQSYAHGGRIEWRLGDFRGDNRGYEILYRDSGRNRWRSAPGYAMAMGDGWVLGIDRHRGGYGIYRWSGRGWTRMPGTAVRIGGSYQQPWVINDSGTRFIWSGYEWREVRVTGRNDGPDRGDRGYRRDDGRVRNRDHGRDNEEYGSRDRGDDRNRRDNDGWNGGYRK